MSSNSLVTVIIGQVGDGFAPVANHCKGTVYIISQGRLQVKNVAALKKRGHIVNHLNANFKKLSKLSKKVCYMRNDIKRNYGGIDVLINTATYNCDYNSYVSVHFQAKTVAYFNCLAVMTICGKLFPILRNGTSTVIYCTLKYNYRHLVPNVLKNRFENIKLTLNHIKLFIYQYLKAIKQRTYEAEWGSSPYAVSRAGFIAMKNLHRNILNIKGIKIYCDFGINVCLDPYRIGCQNQIFNGDNSPFFVDNLSGITDFEIHQGVNVQHNLHTVISNQNRVNENVLKETTNSQTNTKKRARYDSTNIQEDSKKLCTRTICTTNLNNCASTPANLNVAISTKSKRDLTKEEANYIKDELHKIIIATCAQPMSANIIYPAFDKNPCYSEGVLKLWCLDEKTLTWLKDIISKLHFPRDECNLTVIDQRDIPGKVKVALFVPDFNGEIDFLQRVLIAQNRWCDMTLWSLFSYERTTIEKPSGIFLILNIPMDDIPKIMIRRRQIAFSIGSITIRFIIGTGFSNEPTGIINRADVNDWVMVPIERNAPDHDVSNNSFPSLSDALQCIDEFMPIIPVIQNVWGESLEIC